MVQQIYILPQKETWTKYTPTDLLFLYKNTDNTLHEFSAVYVDDKIVAGSEDCRNLWTKFPKLFN